MKICIVAGESSGDKLGALLLKELTGNDFIGIGGEQMLKMGFKSLFDITHLSVMGFVEVLPKIPKILGLMNELAEFIISQKPDIVITIDSPDFNFRLVKKLRRQNFKSKFFHYVAPSVWAYRQGRAVKVARLYDGLFCILPFEPPYFEKYGLKAYFVGHPLVFEYSNKNIDYVNHPRQLISLTLGSRQGEIDRHLPIIKDFCYLVNQKYPDKFDFAFLTLPRFESKINNAISIPNKLIITKDDKKLEFMKSSVIGVCKSGTNALEFSALNVPIIVYYRVNFITAFIAKMIIKTRFANLVNLILNQPLIPELIQDKATAKNLFDAFEKVIRDRQYQLEGVKRSVGILNCNSSRKIADIIMSAG